MKVGKPKSKRVPVRLRHKIEKASAAKQRKQRKLAKKDPTWRSRVKKDPGIPNLFPYKEKLLHEIEEKKREREEENARRREIQKAQGLGVAEPQAETAEGRDEEEVLVDFDDEEDNVVHDESSNPMAALLASARARAAEYNQDNIPDADEIVYNEDEDFEGFDEDEEMGGMPTAPSKKETSRRQYDKVFKQVIEGSDIILYVLDARDPEGTRSKEVERAIMTAEGGNKRLILILNKIDLIPPAVLKGWLVHLRRYFPTLPLRASNPAPNARTFDHMQLTVKGTSETLLKALKSYAQSKQLKRSTSIGVIGYPNVGKSSVINALTSRLGSRNAACPTGAEAGVTTSLREVKLDNKLKLLDSPGIVFPSSSEPSKQKAEEQARLILLSAIPPREIDDPMPAVELLLHRLSSSEEMFQKLLDVYGLPPLIAQDGDVTTDFLVQIARKRGRLGKGGVPNLHAAAQTVVTDWRDGRIQGWVDAPVLRVVTDNAAEQSNDTPMEGDQKKLVQEWSAEFKLEGLCVDGDADDAMEQ